MGRRPRKPTELAVERGVPGSVRFALALPFVPLGNLISAGLDWGAARKAGFALLEAQKLDLRHWAEANRRALRTRQERRALEEFRSYESRFVWTTLTLASRGEPDAIQLGLDVVRFLVRTGSENAPVVLTAVLPLVQNEGTQSERIEAARLLARVCRRRSPQAAMRMLVDAQNFATSAGLTEEHARISLEIAKLYVHRRSELPSANPQKVVRETQEAIEQTADIRDRVFGSRWLADISRLHGDILTSIEILDGLQQKTADLSMLNELAYTIRSQVQGRLALKPSQLEARVLASACERALDLHDGRASPRGIAATQLVHAEALDRAGSRDAAADVRAQALQVLAAT